MAKNSNKYIIVISVLIVLYNVLVWVIPFPKKDMPTFVISYVASMIALLSQPAIYYIAIHNKDSVKSKLYGWPILKVGYVYGIVQLCISILFYIVGAFVQIPTFISIILSVILIGLALIGILLTDTYREEIEHVEKNSVVSTKFILDLRIDCQSLVKRITDEPIHSELVAFAELVEYSDPVSSDDLKEIENVILNKYNELKKLIDDENFVEAKQKTKELCVLIEERNTKCKVSK